jgi:tRNA modification GTPase
VKRFLISCETNAGIEQFLDTLTSLVVQRVMVGSPDEEVANNNLIDDGAVITRSRHRNHVENASAALQRFELLSSKGHMAVDMAAEELRLAASELGRITGAVDVEDVLDVLFTDFCIGK